MNCDFCGHPSEPTDEVVTNKEGMNLCADHERCGARVDSRPPPVIHPRDEERERYAARFAELAQEFHAELRESVNRRIKAANGRREFGVEIIAIYSTLRMCSAQLLASMNAAGVSEADAIKWAATAEKAVRQVARQVQTTKARGQ